MLGNAGGPFNYKLCLVCSAPVGTHDRGQRGTIRIKSEKENMSVRALVSRTLRIAVLGRN